MILLELWMGFSFSSVGVGDTSSRSGHWGLESAEQKTGDWSGVSHAWGHRDMSGPGPGRGQSPPTRGRRSWCHYYKSSGCWYYAEIFASRAKNGWIRQTLIVVKGSETPLQGFFVLDIAINITQWCDNSLPLPMVSHWAGKQLSPGPHCLLTMTGPSTAPISILPHCPLDWPRAACWEEKFIG